jgi:uncharacterized protein YwgA
MNRLQKAALLTELADCLARNGSWCGETHLQKATYFLQTLLEVPLGFDFILYKHGPYSFELGDELTALQADYLLEMRVKSSGYGPSLLPTDTSTGLRQRHPITVGKYARAIEFVAAAFGEKGVAQLERLSTALYVSHELRMTAAAEDRARRLNELKPHVTLEQAREAVKEVDRLAQEARALAPV